MAYSLYSNSGKIQYGIQSYIVDTDTDLAYLSTNLKPGTKAIVLDTGKTYMLNHNNQWKEIPAGGGSGGGDYWEDYGAGV